MDEIKYYPTFLLSFDNEGKKIIDDFIFYLKEDFKDIFKKIENLNDFDYEEAKRIRANEKFSFNASPLCVFIFVFPNETNVKEANEYFKNKVKEEDKPMVKFIFIIKEDIYQKINNKNFGNFFLAMNETDNRTILTDDELRKRIICFLLAILYSNINENNIIRNNFLFSNGYFTIGLEANLPPKKEIREYMRNKFIYDYINIAFTGKEEKELIEQECKKEIERQVSLAEVVDINTISISNPPFNFFFPFFSTGSYRERLKKVFCENASKMLCKYFEEKKEKTSQFRSVLEKNLYEKVSNVYTKYIDFIFRNVKSLGNLDNILKILIDKNGTIEKFVKEKKEKLNWPKLDSRVFNFDLHAFVKWPSLAFLLFLFFCFSIFGVAGYYVFGFTFKLLEIIIFSSSIICLYIIFSKILLYIAEKKFKRAFLEKLRMVDDFFKNSCISLKYVYENFALYYLKWKLEKFSEKYDSWKKNYLNEKMNKTRYLKSEWEKKNQDIVKIFDEYKIDNIFNLEDFLKNIDSTDRFFNDLFLNYLRDYEEQIIQKISNIYIEKIDNTKIKDLKTKIPILCDNITLTNEEANMLIYYDESYSDGIEDAENILRFRTIIPGFFARLIIKGIKK